MTMYINSLLVSGIQHSCPHGNISLGVGVATFCAGKYNKGNIGSYQLSDLTNTLAIVKILTYFRKHFNVTYIIIKYNTKCTKISIVEILVK